MAAATMEFALVLPDNWLMLDPAGERRIAEEVDALLEQGALHDEAYRAHRGRIEKQLRAVVRSIRREPVAMAAVFISVMDEVLPLFAGMTAAVVDGGLRSSEAGPTPGCRSRSCRASVRLCGSGSVIPPLMLKLASPCRPRSSST